MQLAILREASKIRVLDSKIKPAVSGDKILADFLLLILARALHCPLNPCKKPYYSTP